jgi:serine hydrolase
MRVPLLILPGRNNSGPQHWQSLWQERRSDALRIEPATWGIPELDDWMAALERSLNASPEPPILVGHSMGSLLGVCWASQHRADLPISGMFLVAPPNVRREGFPAATFMNIPESPMPYPTLVVASETDPYCPIDVAKQMATTWQAGFVSVGDRGHIATEPGNGSWEEGWHLLEAFAAGIRVQI